MNRGWSLISEARREGPVVLAVDFDASGRQEATFHDLVQRFPAPVTVWLATQPPPGPHDGLTPADYLAWWSDGLGTDPRPVGAVLGYCAGSLFASALADVLEQRQETRPGVVLFNPGKPDISTLRRDFGGTVNSMTLLSQDERAAFLQRADRAIEAAGASFDQACDIVLDLYREASGITFERAGIDPDVGAELLGVFRSYTVYLRAARDVEYRPQWAAATAVLSHEHPREPAFTRTQIAADAGRRHLLDDTDVARTTFALITAGV